MGPSRVFEHIGTVEEIRDNLVRIKMKVTEACGACSAKNVCGSISSEERIVDVPIHDNLFKIGEEVQVAIHQSAGFKAVLIAYAAPVVLLILTLFFALKFIHTETLSALVSLGSVALYYLILYFLRYKIKKLFSFTIRKTEK